MFDFFREFRLFGVAISVVSYGIGMLLKKKFKLAILNPLLISIVITIAFLALTGISYEKYDEGAKYLNYLLTPATVCLAIPLYEQLELLKHNWRAVLLGILSGVLSSLGVILGMALMFGFSHEEYVTFCRSRLPQQSAWAFQKSWAATFPSALPPSSLPVFWAISLQRSSLSCSGSMSRSQRELPWAHLLTPSVQQRQWNWAKWRAQ